MSPRDEAIDLDAAAWNAALALTRSTWRADSARGQNSQGPNAPNGPAVRHVRGFGADTGFTKEMFPVIAFVLGFSGKDCCNCVQLAVDAGGLRYQMCDDQGQWREW